MLRRPPSFAVSACPQNPSTALSMPCLARRPSHHAPHYLLNCRYHDVSAAMIHGVFHGGAAIECPGVVRHTGAGVTHLGLPKEGMDLMSEDLLTDVASALNCCGLPAEVKADTDAAVWEKLVVNAAVNPLTAILGCKNGFLVESEACQQIMRGVSKTIPCISYICMFPLFICLCANRKLF